MIGVDHVVVLPDRDLAMQAVREALRDLALQVRECIHVHV